jgi:hypothetical protein
MEPLLPHLLSGSAGEGLGLYHRLCLCTLGPVLGHLLPCGAGGVLGQLHSPCLCGTELLHWLQAIQWLAIATPQTLPLCDRAPALRTP